MTTKLEAYLKQVSERAEAATEGPWRFYLEHRDENYPSTLAFSQIAGYNKDTKTSVIMCRLGVPDKICMEEADADFIAASRTDVPKLLRIIEVLRGFSDELEGICDREMDYDNHCKENGGRLTSPIAEIKAAIKVWKNDALTKGEEIAGEK